MPTIIVLGGTNGAGKSSIAGKMLRLNDAEYFNPDEVTRRLLENNPGMDLAEANIHAWQQGKVMLEDAIERGLDYSFETTLGGNTITDLLIKAADKGISVRLWYAGLASPELHIARVAARVAAGGHDIPEDKIRTRYDSGRENLLRLLPKLAELQIYDNSVEKNMDKGEAPAPFLILHLRGGQIVKQCPLADTPDWAKPIVQLAIKQQRRR